MINLIFLVVLWKLFLECLSNLFLIDVLSCLLFIINVLRLDNHIHIPLQIRILETGYKNIWKNLLAFLPLLIFFMSNLEAIIYYFALSDLKKWYFISISDKICASVEQNDLYFCYPILLINFYYLYVRLNLFNFFPSLPNFIYHHI